MKTPHVSLLLAGLALIAGPALHATTDLSTLSPAGNATVSPSYATDSAWVISINTTVGGITWTRSSPGQVLTFNGVTGSEILTFSNTSTPGFTENSQYNGTLYWGNMHVVAASGLNIATGYNNLILQSGLAWDSGSAGTLTLTQPASDGNIVYAQGNNVLASAMDLNLGSGSAGSSLVINGGTTQTIGALTGTASDYIGAYSGSSQFQNTITPSGTNTTGATSAATLQIGATNASATFAGVIGSTGVSSVVSDANTKAVNIVKLGTGTQTFTGANTYTGSTTVSAGTLALSGSGSIASSTVYNIAAGAKFDVSALTTPGYSLANVATTLGVGATTSGLINVGTGTLALGGNSTLTLNFTAVPTATTFSLYSAGGVSGDFTSVSVTGTLGAGSLSLASGLWTGDIGGYSLSLNESTGVLTVASAIPEPATTGLILGASILGSIAFLRRRRA